MSSNESTGGQTIPGPPYVPQVAQLGGQPTILPDAPICGVLLGLFVLGAATNMTIFQLNRRRGHKFLFSALLFGFCMARIVALTMRLVWTTHPTNINVAIASNIFTAAGVLLLFIINLIFSQRMLRAYLPSIGWHRVVNYAYRFCFFSVIALLIMVVTTVVHGFFTLDMSARSKERDVQLFAGTYLAVLAFLPIPTTLLSIFLFRRQQKRLGGDSDGARVEKFGTGRFRSKVALLLFTATLLSLGAGFRIGVNYTTPRAATNPAWYHHKACYYCFNFVIELIVVYTYALARFDRRFHVPNGAKAAGDYAALYGQGDGLGVNKESEVFGPSGDEQQHQQQTQQGTAEKV
ncbi:hypothetical protein QBC46DRAFT_457291 [Diplogelasinospora grovesii]|uniref:Family c-likeg-protein-coupled receptor protein n=1 Tax=Diplogelasinospora grovesii TaxID=303347 RepID=A0AAN6S754_9PEZI|nr:hypothetical protein QBC46DRAFT_457291 [Diplogelasinospora grovesii]